MGARAVGQAVKRNPIPIIIPCHRVIREDGALGGFSLGIEIKKRLLLLEGVTFCRGFITFHPIGEDITVQIFLEKRPV